MIYGYVRISTKKQVITRQIANILKIYPEAKIYQEIFTGVTSNRPEWNKLKKIVKKGDVIIFDSVSRMSRNAMEGIEEYFNFFEKGIELIFLKEQYINTELYKEQLKLNENLSVEDKDLNDTIIKGIREYLIKLAEKQIIIAFNQSEKEVQDLRERTKEALRERKKQGVVLGMKKGTTFETKKSKEMKVQIEKLSRHFNGNLKDSEVISLLKLSRGTYYKYKKEIINKM
ncbi:recombinase family protein [Fusobacterium sp.]|uniref:recombinase family protein n=1 Tax=Fusobacterium sp. TaxID=68766 RepID=UPI001D87FFA9|nr:recombinase family protein [Fusobacterium sp.]MBS5789826.1 recombinase family protein [Fusobacterium sp.]